jgi:transcriptional regulator with XRE-family HTH domain
MAARTVLNPITLEATRLLGHHIRLARKQRRWTVVELAERVGVSPVTMRRVETGEPGVAIGTVFEAALLVGVPLFHADPARRAAELDRVKAHLALLPASIRTRDVDHDF